MYSLYWYGGAMNTGNWSMEPSGGALANYATLKKERYTSSNLEYEHVKQFVFTSSAAIY